MKTCFDLCFSDLYFKRCTFLFNGFIVKFQSLKIGLKKPRNHNHTSALMGFVYFINTPKGSSPLVFKTSGKKIKAEEGKIVLFPGVMNHYVPKNKCKNRMILAGNIIFDASF